MLGTASFIGFIPVADVAAAKVFYEMTLGLRVTEDAPPHVVSFDAGGTMLRVVAVPEPHPVPFTIAGWDVPRIEDTIRELAARGVEFLRYEGFGQDAQGIWTAADGDQVAWFKDPDGNVLSLTTFVAA